MSVGSLDDIPARRGRASSALDFLRGSKDKLDLSGKHSRRTSTVSQSSDSDNEGSTTSLDSLMKNTRSLGGSHQFDAEFMEEGQIFRVLPRKASGVTKDMQVMVNVAGRKSTISWGTVAGGSWLTKKRRREVQTIKFKNFKRLCIGKCTEMFRGPFGNGFDESLCMSIIETRQNLNMVAPSIQVRDRWVAGLKVLLREMGFKYNVEGDNRLSTVAMRTPSKMSVDKDPLQIQRELEAKAIHMWTAQDKDLYRQCVQRISVSPPPATTKGPVDLSVIREVSHTNAAPDTPDHPDRNVDKKSSLPVLMTVDSGASDVEDVIEGRSSDDDPSPHPSKGGSRGHSRQGSVHTSPRDENSMVSPRSNSRQGSRHGSRPNSRPNSRPASRTGSRRNSRENSFNGPNGLVSPGKMGLGS
eukprot:g376.t1